MTANRKKPRNTKHKFSALKPGVQKLIGTLRENWEQWDEIKKGEVIMRLISPECGCSYRGLAKDLKRRGAKESTFRRWAELASLSAEDREAFRHGETAKRVLARKKAREKQKRRSERIVAEQETGRNRRNQQIR